MDPSYVNVMETADLAYVMVVYLLHGALIFVQASLIVFLLATGFLELRRRAPGVTPLPAASRLLLGSLLAAPLALSAPVGVSIAAAVLALALLCWSEWRSPASASRPVVLTRRAAVAFALIAASFMVWEREDNLVLGADLLLKTTEFRDEEIAWQVSNDPQSPKVGEIAPDFALQDPSGNVRVRLSDFRGKRPVALVFGSYT